MVETEGTKSFDSGDEDDDEEYNSGSSPLWFMAAFWEIKTRTAQNSDYLLSLGYVEV